MQADTADARAAQEHQEAEEAVAEWELEDDRRTASYKAALLRRAVLESHCERLRALGVDAGACDTEDEEDDEAMALLREEYVTRLVAERQEYELSCRPDHFPSLQGHLNMHRDEAERHPVSQHLPVMEIEARAWQSVKKALQAQDYRRRSQWFTFPMPRPPAEQV